MTHLKIELHDPGLCRGAAARPTIALLLGSLLVLDACGPDKGDDSTSATTDGSGGTSGVDTTASAGDTTPTGSSMTDSGDATTTVDPSDTTAGDVCAELADAVPDPAVKISLHNAGADAVFLFHAIDCGEVPLLDVSGPDADTPIQWMHDICEITCGQALQGACACPPFCPSDAILMIAPGGTFTVDWSGAVFASVGLPQECSADCGGSCLKAEQAAAGSYQLVARASTSAVVCADPNVCTCEPNAEGWCDVAASGIGAELRLAEGTLGYPGTQEITLTFTD